MFMLQVIVTTRVRGVSRQYIPSCYYYIGITHGVPKKLFENKADGPSVQRPPEGPGKC